MQALLPQYQFESLLGRGGMGAVYKAVQVSLDRAVAIKVLPGDLIDDGDANFAERFKNEARTMAKMNHPAIVNVYDFGQTQTGLLYFVMEFVDGTDVAKMIQQQGRLPPEHALAVTAHVCDALAYAHKHGVVHRDIKPANILINMEGAVKVADFGLARADDPSKTSGLTKTGLTMGTPDFVAPEALVMGTHVDGRADLYAIGVMLYNMVTGSIPRGMWTMPSAMLGTDPRFDAIIGRAMQTDRERRYQSAAEIRRDLDVILTMPLVQAGGQSSAAIPQKQLPQKPAAKGPQKPMGKSTKVPVRTSTAAAPAEGTGDPAEGRVPESAAAKKKNLGPIIGIAATVAIAAGLAVMFLGGGKPNPGAAASSSAPASATAPKREEPPKITETPGAPKGKAPTAPPPAPAATLPSPPSKNARQTLDLLALTDPVKDRVPVPSMVGKNVWVRKGADLVFQSDGKSGKLAAPVAINCLDYEIELRAERLSGTDRIHLDVPTTGGRILPLVLNAQGQKVIHGREGSEWGPGGKVVHLTVRVTRAAQNSSTARVMVTRKTDGKLLADWTGSLDSLAKPGEAHPDFPGQQVASIFSMRDPHAIQTWTLRVFEGEAKALRGAAPASAPAPAVIAAAPGGAAINLLDGIAIRRSTVAGGWSHPGGELRSKGNTGFDRFAFDAPAPEEYDFRVVFTRISGNLAVAQHLVLPDGKDVMWIMGGFGNTVFGLEMVGGAAGNANPTTVKMGLENGRRYESVVKVRRDRIQAQLDGKLILDHKLAGGEFAVFEKWAFPDPRKLGLGCQQPTEFHQVELIPVLPGAAAARAAGSVAPVTMPPGQPLPPTPTGPISFGGHRYQFIAEANGGPAARRRATELGGHLVSVNSKEEQDFLTKTYGATLAAGGRVWINGARDRSDNTWRWFNGEPFTFTNWAEGKPDGAANGLAMIAPDFRWDDDQNFQAPFIVEWDADDAPATAPAAAAAATVVPPDDPRVAQLEAGFQAACKRDAHDPHDKAIAALNQSYLGALGRSRATAQAQGSLELVTALDEERTRIASGQGVPPADVGGTPDALVQLRQTYRATAAKHAAERDKAVAPLYDKYVAALDVYVTELTRANAIEKASAIKSFRDALAAKKPVATEPPAPAAPAGSKATAAPKSSAAAPPAAEIRGSTWAAAAKWVLSVGGTLQATRNGRKIPISSEKDTLGGRFDIIHVDINANPKSAGIKDDDFSRLAPLKELKSIRLDGIQAGDAAFAFARTTPELTGLTTTGNDRVTDAVFEHLAALEKIQSLQLQKCPRITGVGFAKLACLPKLEIVWLDGSGLTDAGLSELAGGGAILHLVISTTGITDRGLDAILPRLRNLRTLNIDGCSGVTGSSFAHLKGLAALTDINWGRIKGDKTTMSPEALAFIGACNSLRRLNIDSVPLTDADLGGLAPLRNVYQLALSRSRITGTGFAALAEWKQLVNLNVGYETPITGEGLKAIAAALPQLEQLHLGLGAKLSTEDFRAFGAFKSLRILIVNNSQAVTDDALAAMEPPPALERLDLQGVPLTAAGLARWKAPAKLTQLNLHACDALDDTAIPHLKKLTSLSELQIKATGITEAGAAELKKALPNCSVLR